jgi:hypothetical protein
VPARPPRYDPAKIQLEGYVHAFAKFHDISVDEARAVAKQYAEKQHSLPVGASNNLVRHLPLKVFDDEDPAWIITVIKNVPKAGIKQNLGQAQKQASVRCLSMRLMRCLRQLDTRFPQTRLLTFLKFHILDC